MDYYYKTAILHTLNGLTKMILWLDPHTPKDMDLNHYFAVLIANICATPTAERPSSFVLDQAYIDTPKDDIFHIFQKGTKMVYVPQPRTVNRFKDYVTRRESKKVCETLCASYIAFRRALAEEPESRQQEYMKEIQQYIVLENYKQHTCVHPGCTHVPTVGTQVGTPADVPCISDQIPASVPASE